MERPFCSSELCRQSMCVVPNLTYYQQYRNALSSLFPLYHFQKLFYFDFGLHIGSDLSLFLLIVASGMQSATGSEFHRRLYRDIFIGVCSLPTHQLLSRGSIIAGI